MFVSRDFGTCDIYLWMSLRGSDEDIGRTIINLYHNLCTFATCVISAYLRSPPRKDRLNRVGFGVGRPVIHSSRSRGNIPENINSAPTCDRTDHVQG